MNVIGKISRDGVRWYPRAVIEKYTADQVAYARRHGSGALTGAALQRLCRVPEGGIVFDEGNGVTAYGLRNLAQVLTGEAGHPLAAGLALFGVGSDPAEFSTDHAHLSVTDGEQPYSSWYRPMDPGYPFVQDGTSSIEARATFTETEACFAWHEWCWGSGPSAPAPHHSLRGAYGGEDGVMINRKAHPAGYGVKEPGVAWVFGTVVELKG